MAIVNLLYAGTTPATVYADAATLNAVDTADIYSGQQVFVTDLGAFRLDKTSTAAADDATYIAADGGGNWIKVTTPYVAIDENNTIDSAQLTSLDKLANGTAALPSLAFASDTNLGIYRVTTDTLGITCAGALVLSVAAAAVSIATGTQLALPAGSAAAPAVTFTGDLNFGLYRVAADSLGVSCGGSLALTISATALTAATGMQVVLPGSSAAAPAIAIGGEQSGLYLVGAGSLGIAVAGAIKANLTASALNMATGVALQINAVQVVGARNTGWVTFAGTGTKDQNAINVDTFTATDANIRLLGQATKGILDALILHGLLGA